tara:strand:- start:230 stop:757 length:528 start_codon:yes stop_codon:yes gene_type:complete
MNKFYFKEDNNFLNSHQKNFLENTVMSDNFPFYFYKESVKGDNNIFFSHMVKKRPEIGGEWNSTYKDNFIDILNTFCKKNNIKYNEILRCTINLTIKTTDKKCPVHIDHPYYHKQLLIYLNNPEDTNSQTIILKNNKIYKKIIPKQFKGVCFDSTEHYHYYPQKGYRFVLVYTFK